MEQRIYDFIDRVQTEQDHARAEQYAKFQERAENQKGRLLEVLRIQFPLFCESIPELRDLPSAWLYTPAKEQGCGFGAPGIIVGPFILAYEPGWLKCANYQGQNTPVKHVHDISLEGGKTKDAKLAAFFDSAKEDGII